MRQDRPASSRPSELADNLAATRVKTEAAKETEQQRPLVVDSEPIGAFGAEVPNLIAFRLSTEEEEADRQLQVA